MEIVQKVRKVPTSRRRQEKPSQVTKPEEVRRIDALGEGLIIFCKLAMYIVTTHCGICGG